MSTRRDYATIAHRYAEDVIAGRILACKWVILACKRHQRDLERSRAGKFDYVFAPERAAEVCYFIEGLPHPKDYFDGRAGELIRLESFQVFVICSLFGWVRRDDPSRYRFREALVMMARKNAKSTLAAAIADYKFAAENEGGAEVYFGAASREQAMDIGFAPALAMIERTPELIAAFGLKVNKKSVTKPGDRMAVMKTVIGKPGDGAAPHCWVIDEYHEHADDTQYQAAKTGMGSRKNPLLLVISTAGFDLAGPCRELQDTAEQILEGNIEDEQRFVIIYTLDEGDDYTDLRVAAKANPNLGVSVDPEYLKSQITAAQNSTAERPKVKTKNFNLWVNDKAPWIQPEDWRACADPDLRLEDFEGQECYDALDLADVCDLASKMRMFPREEDGRQHFYLFGQHYLNEVRVREKRNQHYAKWADEGWLTVTPGPTTSYPAIRDGLIEDCERFLVKEVPHDPHHAAPLVQFIAEDGRWDQSIEFVKIEPNYNNFSPAMREFEKAVLEGRVHHNGDPILAWAIANTICRPIARDNIMPDKKRPQLKIDPTIATLEAFMRANGSEPGTFEARITVATVEAEN